MMTILEQTIQAEKTGVKSITFSLPMMNVLVWHGGNSFKMIYEEFLTLKGKDFKGRTLDDIWSFSDKEIEENHDFIQIIFPLNKPSQSVFHGYYLHNRDLVKQIKNNKEATNNIIKSSKWFFSFLERNMYWNSQYNHNQLRITRVIECLRLLVSNEEADNFYDNVLELIKDNNQVNMRTLNFWKNA